MDQKLIGEFISTKRKEKGLTQKELADKLRISEKTISKWETGHGLPEVSNMQPLCNELDITVTELLNGKESKKIREDKVIDYIEYNDKKNKIKIIVTIIIMFIILILSILGIYFFNNYGKTTIYKLDGESEHFAYHNATITISNIRNILTSGKLIINNEIEGATILEAKLMYKDKLIASTSFIKGSINLIEEENGYNEIFTKESLNNLNDWYIKIIYLLNDKVSEETIELESTKILKNDEFFHKTSKPIGINKESEELDTDKEYEKALKQREKLIKEGFTQISNEYYFDLEKKTKHEEIQVFGLPYIYGYIRYYYKDDEGNWRQIKHFDLISMVFVNVRGKEENKTFDYSYNGQSDTVICTSGECPDYIWEEGKGLYEKLINLIKIEEE